MDSLEHRTIYSDVRPRGEAETADKAGTEVADNVAIKVLGNKHVELLRLGDELHTAVVDNDVVRLDVRIVGRCLVKLLDEHPIGELHDVRLVDGGDALPALLAGHFK